MSFRITPHRQFEIGQQRAAALSGRTGTLRDQISSGERVHRPSDDPHAQRLILNSQSTASYFQSQSVAINDVRSVLNEAHVQMRAAQQLGVNARDIGLQVRQINNPSEAKIFALELDGILETLDSIANSKHDGRYLFAGATVETRPYRDVNASTDYRGVAESGSVRIGSAGHIKTFYSGQEVFTTGKDGLTAVRGTTGAAAGSGTASGHGSSELRVSHLLTTFAAGSGIQAGSSSADGDTIIGPAGTHTLEINDTSGTGTSGTISFNGGEPIAFTNADTDLKLTGPRGEVLFVNTSSMTPGFSGTVDITATGTLLLNAGQTTVDIDFSANQTLVDQNGNVRHIDSQGITQTGVDTVQLAGNSDLFETLRSMRDDLLNYEEFSAVEWDATVSEYLGQMESMNDHLLDVVGEQSVDLQTLDRLQDRGEDLQLEAEMRLNELQGTDFATAVLQLQEQQNLTEYTFATLSGVFQVSVLDFLR